MSSSTPSLQQFGPELYLALPASPSIDAEPAQIAKAIPELRRYFAQHGVAPVGPPFVRYHHIQMPERLDIEIGFVLETPVPPNRQFQTGQFPSGTYACLHHYESRAELMHANAKLQDWLRSQSLQPAYKETPQGEQWEARLEIYHAAQMDAADSEVHVELRYLLAPAATYR